MMVLGEDQALVNRVKGGYRMGYIAGVLNIDRCGVKTINLGILI